VVITKADGSNIQRTEIAKTEFTNALHLYPPSGSGWIPEVMTCSAREGYGLDEIWNTIISYVNFTKKSGYFNRNRNHQAVARMYDSIHESLKSDFYDHPGINRKIEEYRKKILSNKISSYQAAQKILESYLKKK
jgi:LAO/AO transport system kinase